MERNLLIELLEDGDKVSLYLHKCVKTLQKIDIKMKEREKQKVIVITGTELLGELSFTINDE